MNNQNIAHAIKQFPLDKFPGVKSIVVTDKIKDNKTTQQTAIVFGVYKKLPIDQIPKDQLLPSTVQVDDEQIVTDVVEDVVDWQFETFCPAVTDSDRDSHRMYTRPIKGGLSIGIGDNEHKRKVGTLGLIVRDLTDGQLVGLTCNHVLSPNIYTTANRQIDTTYNYKDVQVLQPARAEGNNDAFYNSHVIGHVKRIYPLIIDSKQMANEIDAAICTIDADVGVDENTGSVLGLTDETTGDQIPSIPFATAQEIESMTTDTPLFKSSRTTGAFGSIAHVDDVPGSDKCVLRMFDGLAVGVRRVTGRFFSPTFAYHDPVQNYDPSTGGDSGAAVLAWIDNMWKVVGLHFAGGKANGVEYGLACRIDRVAELLKIGDLTDDATQYDHGTTNPVYRVVEGYSDDTYLTIAGKTYWQVGRIAEPVTTD